LSRQQLPEPSAWGTIEDPVERLRTGLADIYHFYRRAGQMLAHIHRDVDEMPAVVVAARHALERSWLDTLMAPQANRR
jgi:hypothetical protein